MGLTGGLFNNCGYVGSGASKRNDKDGGWEGVAGAGASSAAAGAGVVVIVGWVVTLAFSSSGNVLTLTMLGSDLPRTGTSQPIPLHASSPISEPHEDIPHDSATSEDGDKLPSVSGCVEMPRGFVEEPGLLNTGELPVVTAIACLG